MSRKRKGRAEVGYYKIEILKEKLKLLSSELEEIQISSEQEVMELVTGEIKRKCSVYFR